MKCLILGVISLVMGVLYAANFNTYYNDRFNYQIEYPSFLIPQGESENSDGQVFRTKDVELRVWGGYYPDTIDESLSAAKADIKDYRITDVDKKNNSYVLILENANRIVYAKTIYVCDENINIRIYYPKNDKAKWNSLIRQLTKSFKFIGECKK
ncbi:MAG: hypothetical protein H0W64_09280 [Gammaproteobacteria bacterium]|nr:hypothetical protein [Gammaproteobacteria bacterium]